MAISTSLRNRIVGFLIIASTVLIFLPVILSKDMMTRDNNNAVAVNQNGAIKDQNGNLQMQPQADLEQALALGGQSGALQLPQGSSQSQFDDDFPKGSSSNVQMSQGNSGVEILGSANKNNGGASISAPKPGNVGNGVVMNEFSASVPNKTQASEAKRAEEILTASRPAPKPAPQPAAKPAAPKTEVLVAKKNPPAAKPAPKGVTTVSGTRPSEAFVVQVGVFGKKENADNVVKKLKSAGISYYVVQDSSGSRTLFRVYGGRSNNRNDLNDLVPRINKLCGTQSKVVAL